MWRRVEIEARLDHPPEQVFAYLANPTRWHEFAPAVVRRHQIGAGPPDIGTRWEATDRIGPFKFHFVDELVEREGSRRVVWYSSAPWNARVEYVCMPEPGGTRVRAQYEGDIGGWLRLLGLIPAAVMARILRQDFNRLRVRLAAEARARRH